MSKTVHTALLRPEAESRSTVAGDFPLDQNVIHHFPPGSKVLSAEKYGSSAWTVTARVSVELSNGTLMRYFVKCATEEAGRRMMEGEFAAMTELYKTLPSFIPKPLAWGKFQTEDPPTFFFLCDFVDMSNQMPDPDRLCAHVAELHRTSVSPTGQFRFQIRTCQGRTPQATEWNSSWTSFFTKLLAHVMTLDFEINGPWEDLKQIEDRTLSHVIPRLIGALEADGRSIKPSLIHADLWDGNTGTSYDTGDVYVFDAGSYYAHNEMEVAMWRCPYNKISSKIYTKTYFRLYGMSDPAEEWEDRNRMYSVYYNIIYSINHTTNGKSVRQL
ncbi:MAG: hypothetical protein M1836_004629 [Candelina mexicana]|nr:MAG: hypothetical protein M1836_004629 [Candelina mexicana]